MALNENIIGSAQLLEIGIMQSTVPTVPASALVPYECKADSDDSIEIPDPSKKRKRRKVPQKDEWFKEKNRKRRESGKKYLGRQKKDGIWVYNEIKEARAVKERCACKTTNATIKCASITDAQREELFKEFWLLDWKQKKEYVHKLVYSSQPSKPRNRKNPEESRRTQTLKYHFEIDFEDIRVCRTFFLNTLNLGRNCVLKWLKEPVVAANDSFERSATTTKGTEVHVKFDAWSVKQNRKRRENGEQYLGRQKKDGLWKYNELKEARAVKERCSCQTKNETATMKCALITDAQRLALFKRFWHLDWKQKQKYVKKFVHSTTPSDRRRRKNPDASRRTQTLKYHFSVGGQLLRVCQTFFINTLDIGRKCVLNWVEKPLTAANETTLNKVKQEIEYIVPH